MVSSRSRSCEEQLCEQILYCELYCEQILYKLEPGADSISGGADGGTSFGKKTRKPLKTKENKEEKNTENLRNQTK